MLKNCQMTPAGTVYQENLWWAPGQASNTRPHPAALAHRFTTPIAATFVQVLELEMCWDV